MELQTFTFFFLAFVVLTDGAPRDLMDDPVANREAGNPTPMAGNIGGSPSDCRTKKAEAERKSAPGNFIPSCDADGSYSAEQCSGSTGYCWCALADGKEVAGTRRGPADPRGIRQDCSVYRRTEKRIPGIVVGGWEPLDPESELGKEAVNLALEHYQKSVEPDYHVKHIWLAEMQLVSGTNYHLILTLEEADSSSSDEDEDDDKETKSDTCDYKIYKPIQGSPKITSTCLSDL